MKTPPAEEVARGLRRGASEAVEALRDRVGRILGFRSLGLSVEDRRDVQQEVVTQVWQAVNRPGFEAAQLWGFVETVTARRTIDWLRAHRRLEPLDEQAPSDRPGPLADTLDGERQRLARRALARLDARSRRLIYLHVVAGKSYRELESMLGKSAGTLRVRMHRAVQEARNLRERLERDAAAERRAGPSLGPGRGG